MSPLAISAAVLTIVSATGKRGCPGGGQPASAELFTIVCALIRPPKNMISATTKISIPITPLGATWRRRAAGILRLRCSTLLVASTLASPLGPWPPSVLPMRWSVVGVMLAGRVRLEGALGLLLGRDVLPTTPAVLHDIGRDARVEDAHERDRGQQQVGDVLLLELQVHEVRRHQIRLDHGDTERGDQ